VSPLPGTTTENQQADAALFTVVDTPGADAVGSVGEQEKNWPCRRQKMRFPGAGLRRHPGDKKDRAGTVQREYLR